MTQPVDSWKNWPARLKRHLKDSGQTLANLAGKVIDPKTKRPRSEAALRHWMNGTRLVNLNEFIELCRQARADPAFILFGRQLVDKDVAENLDALVKSLVGSDMPTRVINERASATKQGRRPKATAKAQK